MKKFSYLVGGLSNDWKTEDEQSQLNEMGAQGWELVAVIVKIVSGVPMTYSYFKREETDHADTENARFPEKNKQK
jgi:hypothetical protein